WSINRAICAGASASSGGAADATAKLSPKAKVTNGNDPVRMSGFSLEIRAGRRWCEHAGKAGRQTQRTLSTLPRSEDLRKHERRPGAGPRMAAGETWATTTAMPFRCGEGHGRVAGIIPVGRITPGARSLA